MTLVKIRRAAQITPPHDIRAAASLKQGDYLEAEMTESGAIRLKPVKIASREPDREQEAEVLAVIDQARRSYAAERRR
jgi:bifunctional DNA-binding transcriptional regulator/antitoxin component of YhaV-PrlF toxin-antitoxin module